MEVSNEAFQNLENKVYKTRKCRIEAAERFKRWDKLSSYLNIYYSAILIIISIIQLSQDKIFSKSSALVSITTSVLLFSFSMVILQTNYKEKYNMFKECYLQLDELYIDIIKFKNSKITYENYTFLSNRYNEILKNSENHEERDYYAIIWKDEKLSNNEDTHKIWIYKFKYVLCSLLTFLIKILCLLLPFITPFIVKLLSLFVEFF